MYIYHTGATESTDLDYLQYNPSGTTYPHLFKLDTNGVLQWVTRGYSTIDTNYGCKNRQQRKYLHNRLQQLFQPRLYLYL